MKPATIWTTFLLILSVSALYFGGSALYQLHRYYATSSETKPALFELSVKKIHSDLYIPEARYTYEVNGKLYQGVETLSEYGYFREEFLEKDLPNIAKEKKWVIHYNPSSPSVASLFRNYPFKAIAYGAIMIGLFFYFLYLRKFNR